MRDNYSEVNNNLNHNQYLELLKKRQEAYETAQGNLDDLVQNPSLDDAKKYIDNYFNNLTVYYDSVYSTFTTISNFYNNSLLIESDFNNKESKFKSNLNKIDLEANLRYREYQILEYDSFVKDQTIQMLYVGLMVLILISIILAMNLYKRISVQILTVFVVVIAFGYICYILSVILVKKVNINNYEVTQLNFEKPSSKEIVRGKTYAESQQRLLTSRNSGVGNVLPRLQEEVLVENEVDINLENNIIEDEKSSFYKNAQQQ